MEFGCKTFEDYMLAYLKLDVYLLADVFEAFRSNSLREEELDPVNFISLPHLSFQSAFKMTRETIDLLTDIEMYSVFENGIRGGLTVVNKHQIKYYEDDNIEISPSTSTKIIYMGQHCRNPCHILTLNGLMINK